MKWQKEKKIGAKITDPQSVSEIWKREKKV